MSIARVSQHTADDASFFSILEKVTQFSAIGFAFSITCLHAVALYFFVICSVTSLISQLKMHDFRALMSHRVAQLFLIYFLLLAIGLSYTSAPFAEAFGIFAKYNKFLLGIFLFSALIDHTTRERCIHAFIFGMCLSAAIIILQHFNLIELYKYSHYGSDSVFLSHIPTNYMMAVAAFFLIREFELRKEQRALIGALLVMVTISIFMSGGRTGQFIFAVLAIWYFWKHLSFNYFFMASLGLISFVVMMFFAIPTFHQLIVSTIQESQAYLQHHQSSSPGQRMEFYRTSFQMITAHPWFGTGTGSFGHEYLLRVSDPAFHTINPHNEFLHMWTQIGLAGLAITIALFYFIWRDSAQLSESMSYVARVMVIATVVGSLLNSFLRDSIEGHFFVFFIALAFAEQFQRERLPSQ